MGKIPYTAALGDPPSARRRVVAADAFASVLLAAGLAAELRLARTRGA